MYQSSQKLPAAAPPFPGKGPFFVCILTVVGSSKDLMTGNFTFGNPIFLWKTLLGRNLKKGSRLLFLFLQTMIHRKHAILSNHLSKASAIPYAPDHSLASEVAFPPTCSAL